MKVFIIENGISKDIFVVRNKGRFCEKNNLTPRLLDYTIKGASSTRYQEYHKNYRIVDKLEFIEAKEGDRVLWDSGVTGYCVREDRKHFKDKPVDRSVELENELEATRVELKKVLKQKQKMQDKLNIYSKLGREQYRYENMCDVITEKFKDLINSNVPVINGVNARMYSEGVSVLTINDIHIGQVIEEVNNYYDYEIATMRMESIFTKFIEETSMRDITKVSILMLGDLIHSASITKPDMFSAKEFPEVTSAIYCFNLLASQIDRLVGMFELVELASVIGNESRFNNHYNPSNLQKEAKNNLDVVVYTMLKERYRHLNNVRFLNDGDELESVVNIGGKSILMTHGNMVSINHKDLDRSFINLKARLEPVYGNIDCMVLGHIHSTMILDRVFRSSSLAGANSYSNTLGFAESSVSQNMLIINEDGIKAFALKA